MKASCFIKVSCVVTTQRMVVILIALLLSFRGYASFTITVKVKGMPLYPVLLTDFKGDKNAVLDTAISDMKGVAVFELPDNQHVGMYKVVLKDDKYIDFIFNNEHVTIEADIANVEGTAVVVESRENTLYFAYRARQQDVKSRLESLKNLYGTYMPKELFAQQVKAEYARQTLVFAAYEDSLLKHNAGTFAARIVRLKREAIPAIDADAFTAIVNKRKHWFDSVDFNDTLLMYSNALTTKIIDYLMCFTSKYNAPELQSQLFKTAIDTIVAKARVNRQMYEFVVNFLFNGFEQMGDVKMVEYVASLYVNENTCEHEGSKTTLERKVLTYTRLKEGSDAPWFALTAGNGQKVSLDMYANRVVVLVFWATWCPHCQEALPAIKKLVDSRVDNTLEMITVSLDTNKVAWNEFLVKSSMTTSVNVCDGKSWDGEIASAYYLYSTPTIIIIQDKKIISRPIDLESMKRVLKARNLIR